MLNGRKRTTAGLAGLAVASIAGLTLSIPSAPASADPDIDDVKARVDRLYHQAEVATERYNDAKLELQQLNTELGSLQSDEDRQDDRLQQVRSDVRASILQSYQGDDLGAAGGLLDSDPNSFLSQVSTMSTVNDIQDSLLSDYNDQLKAYSIRHEETEARRDKIADLEQQLSDDKDQINSKLGQAKSLLSHLEEQERQEILSRGGDRLPSEVPASGRAAAAVRYAMAQVGDAYVWGAAGPDAFDCSGLTMMAWAQAGVSLPHSSSAQYGMGTHIAESDLQPGDLVFYYSPISHVGMYIGNGLIVNAENPSVGVKVTSLHAMPYVGAVRPG
ncbi:C40 family peptidase [Nocardioides panacisoli]|uniref:C40 family peptidase n=1 Tax=Nocardioides panacisoli TaxID=627624 RepID=A0ABP7I9R6_9ACTN